jgi:uncharacterized glyoxalase superfamily protein PhnB
MKNRSVPTDTVIPHIVYQSVPDAIKWLSNAFGFVEHYRYGDPPGRSGAQMHLGNAWLMLRVPETRRFHSSAVRQRNAVPHHHRR